jgi:hypothetical protein
MKPYWSVANGGTGQKKELKKHMAWFRYNFVKLMEQESSSKHYYIEYDEMTGKYLLCLRDKDKQITQDQVMDMLHTLATSGHAGDQKTTAESEDAIFFEKEAAEKAQNKAASNKAVTTAATATAATKAAEEKKDGAPLVTQTQEDTGEETKKKATRGES